MHSAQTSALISYIYTTAEMNKCIPVFSLPLLLLVLLYPVCYFVFPAWCVMMHCIEDALGFKLGGEIYLHVMTWIQLIFILYCDFYEKVLFKITNNNYTEKNYAKFLVQKNYFNYI